MIEEEKQLILIDLSARLNYGLRIQLTGSKTICSLLGIRHDEIYTNVDSEPFDVDFVKPYLRPMSSMTEEEEDSLAELNCYHDNKGLFFSCGHSQNDICDVINFLNSHHFDYRGLIKKGLALEAPKYMYKFK